MRAAALAQMHSAVRWGKPIEELKAAGLTDKGAADAKDPESPGGPACTPLGEKSGVTRQRKVRRRPIESVSAKQLFPGAPGSDLV